MSYNTSSFNYINNKFKYIMQEDTSQEKSLIHKEHACFSVLSLAYRKPQNFQETWNHVDIENVKAGVRPYESNSRTWYIRVYGKHPKEEKKIWKIQGIVARGYTQIIGVDSTKN